MYLKVYLLTKAVFSLIIRALLTSVIFMFCSVSADEWGSWDDLPDNLLASNKNSSVTIEKLYEQLRSDGEFDSDDARSETFEYIENWLSDLELEFTDYDEVNDLLKRLEDEDDPEEIAEEMAKWLEDQLDDLADAVEDDLKDLEDALEDAAKEDDSSGSGSSGSDDSSSGSGSGGGD